MAERGSPQSQGESGRQSRAEEESNAAVDSTASVRLVVTVGVDTAHPILSLSFCPDVHKSGWRGEEKQMSVTARGLQKC